LTVRLLLVPYDTALRDWRCGAGPGHLLERGLEDHLQGLGVELAGVDVIEDDPDRQPAEVRTAFALMRRVAVAVRAAREAGESPVVLGGNCNVAVGVLSALSPADRRVFWFDAHGEFNTPESTTTGFLDGMGLSIAAGRCWAGMAASVPGFEPIAAHHTCLFGTRALDPEEADLLREAGVVVVPPPDVTEPLPESIGAPAAGSLAYVHVDLDVLDPDRVGRANGHPADGGITAAELTDTLRAIRARFPIGAATIASYAPEYDEGGRIAGAAFAALEALLAPEEPDNRG
jgi:arginase